MADWRETVRAIGQTAPYVVLALVWLLMLQQFGDVMTPRVGDIAHGIIRNTPPCNAPECDFSMFWPAGRLARLGNFQTLYNPAAFQLWRQLHLLPAAQRLDWFYPPPSLLPVMLVSFARFGAAFAIWTIGLAASAVLLLRWAGLSQRVILLSLLSPASLWNVEMGQLELLAGAAAVAGLLMAGKAPVRAGLCFGLLLLKPQAGLLTPVALLARRHFRALFAGAAMVICLLGLTTALLGSTVWANYLVAGLASSRATLTALHPIGAERGIAVFWMLRSLHAGIATAYAVQIAAGIAAAAICWAAWQRSDFDATTRMALAVFAGLLATPYGYVDDMVAYSIALAALAERRAWRLDLADVLFWLWPMLCPVATAATGILLTPVVVALATWRSWRQAGLPAPLPVLPRAG